ncbi:translationally-controlled tumor protein-like [Tenrec ecaudatus]|uniref:translationally-controlled tumor protein-like n=1 Tax=Tenrec ecaudatus TaxID=94439 RepID=UPI003F596D86
MIIYRDLISHDEMFSDIYKIQEIADGLCLELEGKMVSRTEGVIDDSLIGGNASAEGPDEQIKNILANFKNYQVFLGENMNPDGMVALLDCREDSVTPYLIFFKDGLEMEKC